MAENEDVLENKVLDVKLKPIWDELSRMTASDVYVNKTKKQNLMQEFKAEFFRKAREDEDTTTGFAYEYAIQDKYNSARVEFIATVITNYLDLIKDHENDKNINVPGLAKVFDNIMKIYHKKNLGKVLGNPDNTMDKETYVYLARKIVTEAYYRTHTNELSSEVD